MIGWVIDLAHSSLGREISTMKLLYFGHLFVIAFLALLLIPAGAQATTSYTFEGTTTDTFVDVKFTADLTIAGDILTLVLTNDSLNHVNGASPSLNPNDVLSSFYFDIVKGGLRPTLTWLSATGDVYDGNNPGADTLAFAGADDLIAGAGLTHHWDFRGDIDFTPGTDKLTFGVGAAGNNSLNPNGFSGAITDGVDQGIYAGDVSTNNLTVQLVKGLATFTFSGLTGYSEADLANEAIFGLGTQPDSTAFVPEPGTALLMGMGLMGLASIRRRS